MYVIEGHAGVGKTTFALQFLLAGRDRNESCLLVTTTETRDDLTEAAQSHGWSLAGVEVLELSLEDVITEPAQQQTVFRHAQVELYETTNTVLAELERVQPTRVVLDSMSTLRYMVNEPFTYRRHILALRNAMLARGCTVLITDEFLAEPELHLRTLAHGVVRLEQKITAYGNQRRSVEVVKMRAMTFQGGRNDINIERGGIRIYPRLVSALDNMNGLETRLQTGVEPLDAMLGGGLDCGAAILFIGAAGTGKSTATMQCVSTALGQGQSAAVYLFDERPRTWFQRAERLGFNLSQSAANGNLLLQQVDPAEMTPAQFAYELQQAVTRHGVQFIVIDSLTGYVHAMPDEHFLNLQLHELLIWLAQYHVTTILVLDQHGLLESSAGTPLDLSYLTDTVLLFRYYEHQGAIHRALSVVKRRSGPHENTIRRMTIGPNGIVVGEPLDRFRRMLSDIPIYEGDDPHDSLR